MNDFKAVLACSITQRYKQTQNVLKCEYGAVRGGKQRIDNKCYITSAKGNKKRWFSPSFVFMLLVFVLP